MLIFLNGRFVPEAEAVVSVFDRGFLYGDGLFETLLVRNGRPFRWEQHLDRLWRGAEFLGIKPPVAGPDLRASSGELIVRNQMPDALLRLTLSRGVGVRGYSPRGATKPTFVMTMHPIGDSASRWKLVTASFRLPAGEPLAQFKTCNKLAQVLARAEADAAGADEALLLNTDGFVVEGASSNLFWMEGNTVCTPPLAGGILAGVTRAVVLEICRNRGLTARETNLTPDALRRTDGVFLSLSSLGVVEVESLDGQPLAQSSSAAIVGSAYRELVAAETGVPGETRK